MRKTQRAMLQLDQTKYDFLQGRSLTIEEKEENIWRRKICFLQRRRITEKEKEDHLQEAGPSK